MAWAASLSTNAPIELPGYRVPARTGQSQIPESGDPQPANESRTATQGQQIGGQQFGGLQIGGQMINPMFRADRAPNRHVEAHHQVPDPQPPHRQDADAYWADKIAEVMRDQFGI